MWFPSNSHAQLIEALSFTAAACSVLGCLFIIFSYLRFTKLQMFPFKLIFFLSITELVVSIVTFITGDGACWVRGAISDYFELASMMWISVIAFNIRQIIVFGNRDAAKFERVYHLVAWGVPFLLWLPVACANKFGDAGIWCWIPASQATYRWVCYYGPWAILLIFDISVYISVAASLSANNDFPNVSQETYATASARPQQLLSNRQERQVITRVRLYVVVFFWVSFWSFGHRIDELANPDHEGDLTLFAVMHAFFRPFMGFMNSIVYGVNRRLVNEYRILFATSPLFARRSRLSQQQQHELGSTVAYKPPEI